jgi:two-component system sensor histidine kinase SenX3
VWWLAGVLIVAAFGLGMLVTLRIAHRGARPGRWGDANSDARSDARSDANSRAADRADLMPRGAEQGGPARPRDAQPLASLVVEALDSGVVVVNRDERAVLVNPAARAMGILDVDTLSFPAVTMLVRRALESGEHLTASVDLPMGRLGREPIALAVTAVPLRPGPDDRVAGVCLLLVDVSEQRRLEAVRRDFVANVSHELKTPVGALTLLAEAIQDAADEPAMVARFAGRIQHEGARLARLVGELMELSRVQGADPMPGAGEVEVCAVLGEALARTRLAAEQASILVTMSCAPGLRVRGNEAQLATAVANLVDNAVAYSGNGTRVAVTARPSTDEDARPTVDISVTDQGIGIAEADRDRIFERFYRVDPARSRATGGTGLGLAIVKNIATNHLGTVSVWSVNGSGSTFTIRLPRVHSDRSSSAPTPETPLLAQSGVEPVKGSLP